MFGRREVCVTWSLAVLLASCSSPTKPGQMTSACKPSPASANQTIPLFEQPFVGSFPVVNVFDHNKPLYTADTEPEVVSLCGGRDRGGDRNVNGHNGYDYKMPEGTPLLAAGDGRIIYATLEPPFFCPPIGREVQSLVVEILHTSSAGESFVSVYGHLSRIDVVQDQIVRSGEVVGLAGSTGCSGSPHLHFSVFRDVPGKGYVQIDPYGWHGAEPDPWETDARGTASAWMWRDGKAPAFR